MIAGGFSCGAARTTETFGNSACVRNQPRDWYSARIARYSAISRSNFTRETVGSAYWTDTPLPSDSRFQVQEDARTRREVEFAEFATTVENVPRAISQFPILRWLA